MILPLFEFKCKSCARKFTALVGVIADSAPPKCPACGSTDLSKLMSRFAAVRSEEDMLASLSDPDKVGDLEDPANMRKFVKEMGQELGEDLGDEFDEYLAGAEGGGDDSDDAIY
jgi:putative FmdB family regulatory protein